LSQTSQSSCCSRSTIWNFFNEISCKTIINKQKCLFSKNRGQAGKTHPVWRLVLVRGQGDIKKGCRTVNMVEILQTHVWKWNYETCWNYSIASL
jgi:hypothetical protein